MKIIASLVAMLGLAAAPAGLAQGCCAGQAGSGACCDMASHKASDDHEGHGITQRLAARGVFAQPVQSVFDNYIKLQGLLAQDSLEGIAGRASAMAGAIRGDSTKILPPKLAEQAEALGQAKDLEGARAAFKVLSESLISYLKGQKVPTGSYYVAYCPMAKASWVQTGKTIMNPYMGKGMVHCGEIKS